ncbi:Vesicle trafficking between the ER and Golgi, variant 2 [Entomophthora muscae]|uniref:Vesicle trafficking between the ER and Golgi, variant 2 n=1 Tax=Entomophthora muscae TaxID=34485 RepID=A0ACC2RGN8_9FUNG|nr:Vesicle trafficking between the ER and Golgi, variant 2 [Entomophthora muscae]
MQNHPPSKAVNPQINIVPSLRQLQTNAVLRMLNYNETIKAKSEVAKPQERPLWKVLLFDENCQKLISLILRVNDLREHGVTLHMPIRAARNAIADVPAIYFVKPTQENIELIAEDLKRNLYDSTYINFASALARPLLEDFATRAVTDQFSDRIAQVYDQYLSFMCPEDNLFSLGLEDTYRVLNGTNTSESDIEVAIDKIATGLMSVLATVGAIPIIKAGRGNAAEMLARRLDMQLKDFCRSPAASLASNDSLFSSKERPVLVLLDRNMDLIPMVAHSWTYQPLIHDLLELELNRVVVQEDQATKKYDIDVKDFFWAKNAGLPFPQLAEEIDAELSKYKREAEELTRATDNTQQLKNAVTALPELTNRKSIIDMHMAIATALLGCIQKRHIDKFFELEESILRENKQDILDTIADPALLPEDKMRLFLVYYLSHPATTDVSSFQEALAQAGCDLAPLEAIKRVHAVSRMSALSAGSTDLMNRFTSLGTQLRDGAYSRLMSKVQNFLPTPKDLAITKVVQAIVNPSAAASGVEDLLHIDPKSRSPLARTSSPIASSTPASKIIVFVVGGGSYSEYLNLQDFAKVSLPLDSLTFLAHAFN